MLLVRRVDDFKPPFLVEIFKDGSDVRVVMEDKARMAWLQQEYPGASISFVTGSKETFQTAEGKTFLMAEAVILDRARQVIHGPIPVSVEITESTENPALELYEEAMYLLLSSAGFDPVNIAMSDWEAFLDTPDPDFMQSAMQDVLVRIPTDIMRYFSQGVQPERRFRVEKVEVSVPENGIDLDRPSVERKKASIAPAQSEPEPEPKPIPIQISTASIPAPKTMPTVVAQESPMPVPAVKEAPRVEPTSATLQALGVKSQVSEAGKPASISSAFTSESSAVPATEVVSKKTSVYVDYEPDEMDEGLFAPPDDGLSGIPDEDAGVLPKTKPVTTTLSGAMEAKVASIPMLETGSGTRNVDSGAAQPNAFGVAPMVPSPKAIVSKAAGVGFPEVHVVPAATAVPQKIPAVAPTEASADEDPFATADRRYHDAVDSKPGKFSVRERCLLMFEAMCKDFKNYQQYAANSAKIESTFQIFCEKTIKKQWPKSAELGLLPTLKEQELIFSIIQKGAKGKGDPMGENAPFSA